MIFFLRDVAACGGRSQEASITWAITMQAADERRRHKMTDAAIVLSQIRNLTFLRPLPSGDAVSAKCRFTRFYAAGRKRQPYIEAFPQPLISENSLKAVQCETPLPYL